MAALRAHRTLILLAWIVCVARGTAYADQVAIPTNGGLSAAWDQRTYDRRDVWAFQPARQQAIPDDVIAPAAAARSPVDAFIQQRLKRAGVTRLAAPADRRVLIRRVTFDLTCLPPTPEEVERFVDGLSQTEAVRRLEEFGPNAVERLLGESLARRFLRGFTDLFAAILWVAAGLSLMMPWRQPGAGMATLSGAIVAVIVINGVSLGGRSNHRWRGEFARTRSVLNA